MKNLNRYIFEGSLELPEEISKLTNRSDQLDIDNAIAMVLNLDPDMDENKRYYEIQQFKVKNRSRYGYNFLTKTAQIAKIIDTFKQNVKDKEHAEAVEKHNKYLASPEGKKRKKEFDDAVAKLYGDFDEQKEISEKNILSAVKRLINFDVEVKFDRTGGDSVAFYTSNKRNSVEVSYYNYNWRSSSESEADYKYKVNTTSYGPIEPDEPAAQAIILQGICLQDEKLITTIKNELKRISSLHMRGNEELFNLKKEYTDLEIEA